MAKPKPIACLDARDPTEQRFRKDSQWYSFTGSLYQAVGGAAFFGLLATVANAVVKVAAGATAEAAIFAPLPLAVMGGMMAIGTLAIYMSQSAYTELRCLNDEHLAYQNAKQLMNQQSPAHEQEVLHEQNVRADGKKWSHVVRPGADQEIHQQI